MKGQANLILLMVSVFAVAVVVAITIVIWSNLTTSVPFESLMNATHTGKVAQASATTSLNILANAIVFIFLFSCVASIIAASLFNSSPVFAILGIILMPVELLFSFIFHDVFLSLISASAFGSVVTAAPSLVTLFQYLPLVTLVVSLIIIAVSAINP